MGTGLEIALITSAVTTAASGFMSYQQSRAQADAMEKSQQRNAEIARQNAEIESARLVRQQRDQMGRNIVSAASSGTSLSTYSDLFSDQEDQMAMDLAMIDYNTNLQISGSQYNTANKVRQVKAEGTSALIGSIASAGSGMYSAYSLPGSSVKEGVASSLNKAGYGETAYNMLDTY